MSKLLTAAEERDLIQKAQAGDLAARDRILLANQGLVWRIARRMSRNPDVQEDMVQDGQMGLLRAIEKFDLRLHTRLTTYATFWIHQFMVLARKKSGVVRAPSSVSNSVRRALRVLESGGSLRHFTTITRQSAQALHAATQPMAELDVRWQNPVSEDVSAHLQQVDIRAAMLKLAPRFQRILALRFGLDGEPELTQSAIGAVLHLSKERVRQLEAIALGILRSG